MKTLLTGSLLIFILGGCTTSSGPEVTASRPVSAQRRMTTGSFIPSASGEEPNNVRSVSQPEAQRAKQSAGF